MVAGGWVVFPRKKLGVPLLGVCAASATTHCKTNAEDYFQYLPFLVKAKILCGFLAVSQDRYQCRSFVKAKWHKINFQNAGGIYSCKSKTSGEMERLLQSSRRKVVRLRQEYQAMTTSSLGIYSEGRTANRTCQRITCRIQKRRRVKNDPSQCFCHAKSGKESCT